MFSHTVRLASAADLVPLLDQLAGQLAWPDKARFQIELALEELTVNTFTHGKQPAGNTRHAPISIDMLVEQDAAGLTITLRDNAVAFDPTQFGAPDVTSSAEDRKVGGLGLFLAARMMDSIQYTRKAGSNQVVLRKHLA